MTVAQEEAVIAAVQAWLSDIVAVSLVDPFLRSRRLGRGRVRLPNEPPVPVGRPPGLLVL
jgi:hypothetical protein